MKTKQFILCALFLLFFVGLQAQTQTFTTSGTFTVPAGVTSVTAECWGGGGKGGSRTTVGVAGGAGGGAYSLKVIAVTPGNMYTVTVGMGSSTTAAGGDSWFISNTTVLAKGGNSVADDSATGATGGASASGIGDVKFSSGNGADGGNIFGSDFGGGGGSSAGNDEIGRNGFFGVGGIAPTEGGNGGNGGYNGFFGTNLPGSPGVVPGGGGGGALSFSGNQTGGNGANGQVILSWSTTPTCTLMDPIEVNQTYTFDSDCNFVVPSGYSLNITVQAWGGGGGGGTGAGSQGGGGGGGYVSRTYTDITAGSYPIVVGAGGDPGSNGGPSSFNFTGLVTAPGGNTGGNNGGTGGNPAGADSATNRQGGSGGNRNNNDGGGGGGGSGATVTNGSNGGNTNGGNGGTPSGGIGGNDSNTSPGNNGANGATPGGGGGGKGVNGATSGKGGEGQVIVTITNVVLPINLLSFTGKRVDKTIELHWQTATEQNNDYMAVERAADGIRFSEIGRVNGMGTTNHLQNYSFLDESPLRGTNYYRLRQVDFDGQMEYHRVITVDFLDPTGQSVKVYPNPAQEQLQVSWETGQSGTMLQLFNARGQMMAAYTVSENQTTFEVPLQQLSAGIYFVKWLQGDRLETVRFIKE